MAATKGEQFAGLTVAVVTPFKDGEVDYKALEKLVDFMSSRGRTASPRWEPLANPPPWTMKSTKR